MGLLAINEEEGRCYIEVVAIKDQLKGHGALLMLAAARGVQGAYDRIFFQADDGSVGFYEKIGFSSVPSGWGMPNLQYCTAMYATTEHVASKGGDLPSGFVVRLTNKTPLTQAAAKCTGSRDEDDKEGGAEENALDKTVGEVHAGFVGDGAEEDRVVADAEEDVEEEELQTDAEEDVEEEELKTDAEEDVEVDELNAEVCDDGHHSLVL